MTTVINTSPSFHLRVNKSRGLKKTYLQKKKMADSPNSYRGSLVNHVTSWPGINNLDHDIEWFTFRVSHTKRLSKCFDQLVLIITQALAFSPVSSGFELTTTPQHFKNSRNAHSNMFLLKNNLIYMRKYCSV